MAFLYNSNNLQICTHRLVSVYTVSFLALPPSQSPLLYRLDASAFPLITDIPLPLRTVMQRCAPLQILAGDNLSRGSFDPLGWFGDTLAGTTDGTFLERKVQRMHCIAHDRCWSWLFRDSGTAASLAHVLLDLTAFSFRVVSLEALLLQGATGRNGSVGKLQERVF